MNARFTTATLAAILTTLAATCLQIASANAADLDSVRTFRIKPQSLEAALIEFSTQADLQVMGATETVADAKTQGVYGIHTSREALQTLLEHTPVAFKPIGTHSVQILRSHDGAISERIANDGSLRFVQTNTSGIATQNIDNLDDTNSQAAASKQSSPQSTSGESDTQLQEVVVTAQRRSQNLQKVPISVATSTASELAAAGITRVQDLKMITPGVEIQSNNGYAFPIIRGVGSKAAGAGTENPIAIYVDGVYYAAAASTLMSFNNIDRVEVLKGPQGTLFGRNATGGLIQIVTKDPSQTFAGSVNVGYGNFQTTKADAYVTGPIGEHLAADLAFSGTTMGEGYGRNLYNGRDVYRIDHDIGLRSKWLWTPEDDTQVRASFDYSDTKSSMHALAIYPGEKDPAPYGAAPTFAAPTNGGSPWNVNSDVQPQLLDRSGGASVKIDHDFGIVRASSITAYRAIDHMVQGDGDFTPVVARAQNIVQKDNQVSQELQMLSPNDSRITWVVGGFYFHANSAYDPFYVSFLGNSINAAGLNRSYVRANETTDSVAAYAQSSLEIVHNLTLTTGLRYTTEERELLDAHTDNGYTNGTTVTTLTVPDKHVRFNKVTWRVALDYQFTDNVLGYISQNRGFKSGGFNSNVLSLPAYAPEVLDAYEAGFKTNLWDRRIRFDGAAFYYDYQNIQVVRQTAAGTGIYNGQGAKIYGGEASFQARVTRQLDLDFGYQYAHGRYSSFPGAVIAFRRPDGLIGLTTGDASGHQTVLTPENTFSAAADYTVPLDTSDLHFNVSYYYNSGYYQEADNFAHQGGYSLVNSSLRLEDRRGRSVSLWVDNMGNKAVANLEGIQGFGAFGEHRINYSPPRTFGFTVGTKF